MLCRIVRHRSVRTRKARDKIDLSRTFKKFSVDEIESRKLPLPVKVEFLDLGMNPIFEMEVRKNAEGDYVFANERPILGTVARPGPYRAQFTPGDRRIFLLDWLAGQMRFRLP